MIRYELPHGNFGASRAWQGTLSLARFLKKREKDWTQPMLQKCANPSCTAPFRSLREGKLFLAETLPGDPSHPFDGARRKMPRREHFWLCNACSAHFTLCFDAERGMLTVPLTDRTTPRFLIRAAGEGY